MDSRDFQDFQRQMQAIPVRNIVTFAAVVIGIVVVISLLQSSFYTVGADEQAVIQRLGRYVGTTGPGLHGKLPFGIDRATTVKVGRVHKLEFGFRTAGVTGSGRTQYAEVPQESIMLTGDQNIANVEWIVQFRIKEPEKYLFNIANPEDTIRDVSEAAMRLVVGDSSVTEVLTERRVEVAHEVKDKLQAVLDGYEAGIDVGTVELQNVNPPKQVRDSFNEVNRARQEMDTTINRANKEYMKTIPEVKGEARQQVQIAEGYKIKRINEAHGDVAKFQKLLDEYEVSKEITRKRLYLETVAEVLPKIRHIYMVDKESGGPLQILDLKEGLRRANTRTREAPRLTPENRR